jgi:hypothetical protein
MMELKFSKLYHKSDLANNGAIFNVPGVYIWGFIYEKKGDQIGDPVDFTKEKATANPDEHVFIPYYVGESSGKIKDRFIKEHVRPRINPAYKRTRLTLDYIKEFFKDPTFPLNSKHPLGTSFMNGMTINSFRFFSWVQLNSINKDKLQYFNNEIIMQLLYPRNPMLVNFNNYANTNFPITDPNISINDNSDSLNVLMSIKNNFFFTYCKLDTSLDITEEIETYTTLSLKGKTLAEITKVSHCVSQMNAGDFHEIIDNTGFNIFKQPNQLWINPQGPFDISNIAFPGYL